MADPVAVSNSSAASSSSASTSYSHYSHHYDIFINHRGPDVKKTFASHLYRRLVKEGMSVFLDKEELEEGQNVWSQIEDAIRVASVHIAILSPTYAQSPWCLNELVCMKDSGATILPVFYKVDPSVVRHNVNDGEYAEALRGLEHKRSHDPETGEKKPRYSANTIQIWRNALSYVADLSGFLQHGDDDDEGELLDKLVERVLKKVQKTPLDVGRHPTGLVEKLQDFEKAVLSQDKDENRMKAKAVGIVGVGGVGKTTLAKEFFNLKRSDFNSSSFLLDARENARSKLSLAYLQSKLLRDLKQEDIKIESPDEGIGKLRKYLLSCHALVILDDIDHVSQLEALLWPIRDILSSNSLIVATSRDKHVLESSEVLSIYNLKGLDRSYSEKLFCSYAFSQSHPRPEFEALVDQFVTACGGLPLSLKVFGALVCRQNESYWKEILKDLPKALPTDIEKILKISYDSLCSKDQEIFLNVVCFSLGQKCDTAIRIWGMVSLQNLQDKCLLELEEGINNRIRMHDHIRDMGRNISQGVPMPRRLSQATTDDIDELLEESSCIKTEVRGIVMRGCNDTMHHRMSSKTQWCEDEVVGNRLRDQVQHISFRGICSLQLVAAEDGYLELILRRARLPDLLWVRWYKCPCPCLPSWIPMVNLKVLEVAGSRLETLWQHESQAPMQLRELDICSPSFSSFPKSIGQLKHLEKIVIRDKWKGIALKSLPDEFCDLRSLKYLSLCLCDKMISLPDSFGCLTNLQQLNLTGASSLQSLPESFRKLIRLKELNLQYCRNLTLSTSTLGDITTLECLDLERCANVTELPPQIANQRFLRLLSLGQSNIKELPSWIGQLCNLESLTIGNGFMEVLPPSLSHLKSLKSLDLEAAPGLTDLSDHFAHLTQLRKLHIMHCGIESLPQDLLKMNNLSEIHVHYCPLRELPFKKVEAGRETGSALNELESSHGNCMFGLHELFLWETEISEVIFPEGVCTNLRDLSLLDCKKLTQIGGLSGLIKLQDLDLSGCVSLEELPNIEMLISLEVLDVHGCIKLQSIPWLGQLRKLRELNVRGGHKIQNLSGAEHLMLLKELDASDCPNLRLDRLVFEQIRERLNDGLVYDECITLL